MKEIFRVSTHGRQYRSKWMRRLAATWLEAFKRGIALVLVGLMIPMGIAQVSAFAQEAPPPPPPDQQDQGPPPDDQRAPPQQWNALSPDQLNELVAPIALYPDSLVAQVLAASTYPTQVVEADRFVQSQGGAPPDQIAQEVNGQSVGSQREGAVRVSLGAGQHGQEPGLDNAIWATRTTTSRRT